MQPMRKALRNLPDAVFADLMESSDAYLLVIDLPGTTREDVRIEARRRRLEIEASRQKSVPDGFSYRSEERPLFLDATIPVPMDAVPGEASATMEHGVLEIHVPKTSHTVRNVPIEG